MYVLETIVREVALNQAFVDVMLLLQVFDGRGEVDLALEELVRRYLDLGLHVNWVLLVDLVRRMVLNHPLAVLRG